jgi:hypothetical protein
MSIEEKTQARQALDAAWREVLYQPTAHGSERLSINLADVPMMQTFALLSIASSLVETGERIAEALETIAEQGPGT